MPYRPIQLPAGIERNNSAQDTPDRWWDMNQVRWQSGTLMPIGGWERNTATALDSPIRAFNVWRDNTNARAILAASDSKIYVDDSGEYTDITPDGYTGPGSVNPSEGGYGTGLYGSDTYGTPRSVPSPIFSPFGIVSYGQWGEDVIICSNSDGKLYYYDQTHPTTAPVPIGPSYSATATASFTASITSNIMDVTAVASGNIAVGDKITGTGITGTVTVTSFGTGTGTSGTYNVSTTDDVSSETIESFNQLTTGAPVSNTAVHVTAERHVMAIGVSGNTKMIGWSSQEDQTDWDFQSLTNTAGFLTLSAKDNLLFAVSVAEGTLVFSYSEVFLIRYVGQPSVYGGTAPISDTALFNPRSIATFGGKAVWPSRQGFQLYSGGYVQPLPCPVMSEIMSGNSPYSMDPTWGPFRIHGAHNARFTEVWWFYPSVGQTECDRYIKWNYVENTWDWGSLPRSAMAPADSFQYPMMGGSDSHIYTHEVGWLANGASRVGQVWVETGALSLGAGDQTVRIDKMQIATGVGAQNLTVQFFGRYAPEGTEYTDGPYTPRSDGYTDVRIKYRDVRMRLTNAQDGNFSVGLIRMNIIPSGKR
jgi:hypothetical protein